MADNIRIIGNINDIQRINRLKTEDLNLLDIQVKNQTFGFENDYIEYFIYDGGGNLIDSNYNYKNFKLPSDSYLTPGSKLPLIEIDPTSDLQSLGYISGQFKTQYNFQTKKVSSPDAELFISKISEDRTELSIKSTIISSEDLIKYGNGLINELENSLEQKYFILNLQDNTQVLVVNVAIKVEDSSILLKLYEPLIQNISEKETCWITEEIIEPYVFDINLDTSVIPADAPLLRGPNFDINIDIKQNVNTDYQNYSSLVSSLTGSSYQQVLNYMNDNSYDLNIDYTSFENFIHFSSAETRLNIFYSKVKQIENYNNNINIITGSTNVLKNEQTASIKLEIDNIIKNFDGFENYMYFESSSYAWPKTNNIKPYYLASTGSANVVSWYDAYTGSAEIYDENNLDRLYNVIPNFIKSDPTNYQSYYDFVDMIGHYFDNIWIYITSINELYNADNNLEKGVSKDTVYDALQSLGVKLYNSKGDDNFSDYIGGLNSGSTLFTDNFSITSSYLNNIPKKDLLAETYKRIYHNIPLLSKTRGTSAGLQNLINTFGVSSSILNPKEFGGSTKKNEIKGFDNDKITIQNNTITGSVLSPFISLQQESTSSTEFTSTDLHFVDLSFSPQNELNTRLSASIATLAPTFSLDDYIGDPALMASSSYQSLIQQNNYFISASSAVSGSEKPLDYKGFIELVKYFDNSLFKMLKDFVPARANALTGVTIKSSVLERNKIPVYQPKVEENTVYEAEYAAPIIEEDKSYYYDKINGNKTSFYDGQITGSYVNVYSYFDDEHINPYLFPTESVDINKFNHTDFNITLNNVSSSVISSVRQKVEPLYTATDGKVFNTSSGVYEFFSNAELQDSNLNLLGHKNSRYEGTKLSGLRLNRYSPASTVYSGDISFGKEPVINHYTRKLGLFTQIQQNPFFTYPKQNNVFLKYLVDESGSLTELNKKNKNWEEVQNIFKSGEILTVAQFDNARNSQTNAVSQKSTDGEKLIYTSGYSYFPILYNSSSLNFANTKLYFNYTGKTLSQQFKIKLNGGIISGSTPGTETYPIVGGKIFKAVDKSSNTPDPLYSDGNIHYNRNDFSSFNTFSTYSIQETGNQQFNFNFTIQVDFQTANQQGSFTAAIKKVGGSTLASATSSSISGVRSTVKTGTDLQFAKKIEGNPTYVLPANTIIYDANGAATGDTLDAGTPLYKIIAGGAVDNNCEIFGGRAEYLVKEGYFNSILTPSSENCTDTFLLPVGGLYSKQLYTYPSDNFTSYLNFELNTGNTQFVAGDKIAFELTTGSIAFTTNNFTASILPYNELSDNGVIKSQIQANQLGNNPFATSSEAGVTVPFISGSSSNTLLFNRSLTNFKDYLFLPSGSGFTQNVLWKDYSDALFTFSPKEGDLIVLYYGSGNSYFESEISNVNILNNQLALQLYTPLPSVLNKPAYSNSDINQFLILTKIKDEANVLLQFDKKDGETSIGFIIPNNIHPDVLDNIDTITKEVKQKLIDYGVTNTNF
jgi:hypothetical protein